MKKFILTLLIALLASPALFAGVLKGRITDAKGEELPFATVYIQGTTNGTSANANAEYRLNLEPGTYKVLCQYMGFKQGSFTVTIQGGEVVNHNFSLQELSLQMKTVVVKANSEDPAYAIIRKAIARRQVHLQQVRSFQASIYLKGVFRNRQMPDKFFGVRINGEDKESLKSQGLDTNGRGILYLCEEQADYYSRGSKERTIIRSVRESGNPNGLGLSSLPSIVTFYENNVQPMEGVCPRGFVSPISDNAIHYYKYKYEGEFVENGYTINKIKVTPRREYEPLMTGTIYIAEGDWAIHSLDLLATAKYNLEFIDTLRIQQSHLPLKQDTWVVKNQVLYPTIKIIGFDVSGYFMTVYDKQKVNEPVPDSLFNSKIESSYDRGANKKDTSYWTENRPVPLEVDESQNYVVRDSLLRVVQDPKRNDSIRRRGNKFQPSNLLTGGYHYTSKGSKSSFSTNSVLNGMVNYNTVEGLNISPRFYLSHKMDTGKSLNAEIATRYGFSNTHFNALGKLYYQQSSRELRGRYWKLGMQGGKYVYQFNTQSAVTPLYNTITTLAKGHNYLKMYERWDGALSFDRNYGTGLQWSAKLNFQHRLPLNNTTTYSWAKDAKEQLTDNIPAPLLGLKWEEHSAALVKVSASYQPGFTYTQYPDYKRSNGSDWPTFSVSYEKGIPGILNSKSDFDKWRFGITDDVKLKLMGNLSYNVAVGGFLNSNYVSLPDMMHITDNQIVLASPYLRSFQIAPYYQYSNKESIYGEVHIEYYMKGLLTNKLPLLRQAKWYLVVGTNSLYMGQNKYYTEAFAGIDNLGYKWFRFLRVDFVQSWDSNNRSMTGIRIGLNLGGLGGGVSIGDGKASVDGEL